MIDKGALAILSKEDLALMIENLHAVNRQQHAVLTEFRCFIAAVGRARAQYPQGCGWDNLNDEIKEAQEEEAGTPCEIRELVDIAVIAWRLSQKEWTKEYAEHVERRSRMLKGNGS